MCVSGVRFPHEGACAMFYAYMHTYSREVCVRVCMHVNIESRQLEAALPIPTAVCVCVYF